MRAVDFDFHAALTHPFPGLRPFEAHEAFLFFGREVHTRELLRRLSMHRMLAVVGSSGSGKSSLVRAGLLPALYSGHLVGAGTGWRIAVMRPGSAPLDELASALHAAAPGSSTTKAEIRRTLGRTSLGLIEAVRLQTEGSRESLLLVVDQFEELFRFRREREHDGGDAEASLFVAALLEAVGQFDVPIYLVLTMRSDFLGDCAQFPDLPEALNRSQYLIPRLTREQCREAIVGPMRVAGGDITPRLVERLLNEIGDDPDQLPILQHALAATFIIWKRGCDAAVDFKQYEDAGGVRDALNRHAESVYESLESESAKRLAERIFRCITATEGGRAIRRGARMSRIIDVVGMTGAAGRAEVRAVIRRFADLDNSFLLAGDPTLPDDTVVDISHESLIRKWSRLSNWVKAEAESADWYRSLAKGARMYRVGEAGLWRNPQLRKAINVRKRERWNVAWAEQYAAGYDDANGFLKQSASRTRREGLLVIAIIVATLAGGGWGYWKYSREIGLREDRLFQAQLDLAKANADKGEAEANLSKLNVDLQLAKDPTERQRLEDQIQAQKEALERLSVKADVRQNQVSASESKVGDQEPRVRLAMQQIEGLQKELTQVKNERDDAQQRVRKAGDEPSAQRDLVAARTQIAILQKQLEEAKTAGSPDSSTPSAAVAVTTVFPCSAPQIFRIQKESVYPFRLDGEEVYLTNVRVHQKEVDIALFMTDKPWWGEKAKLNSTDELSQLGGLTKAKVLGNRSYFQTSLNRGASFSAKTASGWNLSVRLLDFSYSGDNAVIKFCGTRSPDARK